MIYNDDRPEHIRGAIWMTVLVLGIGYVIINAFVPNSDMNIAVGVLQASAATMVVYIYGRDAWIALRTKNPKRTDFLIVGIVLAWLSTDGQAILAVLFRLAGMPQWFVNSEIYAPIRLLSVVAAVLHVSAPGAVDGVVPRRNRLAMGIGLGGAVLMVLALLWSRPDIGPLIERTRPWIGDLVVHGGLDLAGGTADTDVIRSHPRENAEARPEQSEAGFFGLRCAPIEQAGLIMVLGKPQLLREAL